MIRPMRRWLLILMVALLPLRGWVGDAMAAQMAGQQLTAIESIAGEVRTERATGHFVLEDAAHDCHSVAPASDPAEGSCASCVQCQVCSALVLPSGAGPGAAVPARGVPAAKGVHFASAPRAPVFKPPIA